MVRRGARANCQHKRIALVSGSRATAASQRSQPQTVLGRLIVVLPNSAWVHKQFDCETLFGKAPFEVLQFNLSQLGFEQALIPFNILVMCAQAGSSSIHDEIPPLNAFLK
jgi:hypothetical protein